MSVIEQWSVGLLGIVSTFLMGLGLAEVFLVMLNHNALENIRGVLPFGIAGYLIGLTWVHIRGEE